VLDGLKARLEQLLREGSRNDPRAYAAGLREALLEGKLGVGAMREALAATERELTAERKQLEDAERRGRLAAAVPDAETVAIAERKRTDAWWTAIPGFVMAFLVHSLFNHFVLSPIVSTIARRSSPLSRVATICVGITRKPPPKM